MFGRNLKYIGMEAFSHCHEVEEFIDLSKTKVTEILDNTFYQTWDAKGVDLDNYVLKYIGYKAFYELGQDTALRGYYFKNSYGPGGNKDVPVDPLPFNNDVDLNTYNSNTWNQNFIYFKNTRTRIVICLPSTVENIKQDACGINGLYVRME